MANMSRETEVLLKQLDVDVGGDVDQLLERWDPDPRRHDRLVNELGGRVTDEAPFRLLWEKKLTASDVSGQQNRFVLPRNAVRDNIVRCLTSQQRDDLCNKGKEILIVAFDEQGQQWLLRLKKRMQKGHDTGTYVLIGEWTQMVTANGWKKGSDIKIWGLPYAGREDQWRFGPDHDFSDITFLFTTAT